MHINKLKKYYFINKLNLEYLKKLNKDVSIIYRNYSSNIDEKQLIKIRDICRKDQRKLFLSNNYKLAFKLDLDGVYLPSFNKCFLYRLYPKKKNFLVLGSAHNIKEIREKEKQGVDIIFIASLFKRKNTFLGLNKFNILSKKTKCKIVALGGIKKNNLNKLNLLNIYGFSGISFFETKKNGP